MDVEEAKIANLSLWEDKPAIEAALMYPGRYVIDSVYTKDGELFAVVDGSKVYNIDFVASSRKRAQYQISGFDSIPDGATDIRG